MDDHEDAKFALILELFPAMNPDQVAALRWIISAAQQPRPPRLLRVPEVAERLGFSTRTVYLLIRSGRLRAVRLGASGSSWRVVEEDLANFIAALESNDVDWRSGRLR